MKILKKCKNTCITCYFLIKYRNILYCIINLISGKRSGTNYDDVYERVTNFRKR